MGASFAPLALFAPTGFFQNFMLPDTFFAEGKKVKTQKLIGPQHGAKAQNEAAAARTEAVAIGNPQEPRVEVPAAAA